jgi:hypothetical protein
MATLRINYRLPSRVVLQADPLPELEFTVEHQALKVREPLWDDDLAAGCRGAAVRPCARLSR